MELRQENPNWRPSLINKIIGISSRMFCYYKQNPKEDRYAEVKKELKQLFDESNGLYGKRRLCCSLRTKGIFLCVHIVSKLMRQCGLEAKGAKKRVKYNSYVGHYGRLHPNLVNRNFKPPRPNHTIVTDVTEFMVSNRKLYLSVFIDLYNNRIVAYTLSCSPSLNFVCMGLKEVLAQIDPSEECIIHSDQGWQYQHPSYQDLIRQHPNVTQSMSRKGTCLDNAAVESFFNKIKEEIFYDHYYRSVDDLADAIDKYCVHYTYHRIQVGLNGLAPANVV